MVTKEIAEMAVKDIAAAKESNIDFENPLPFGNPPINSDEPLSFWDMDEIEQSYALFDISISRDNEIREIRERLTHLSGGRLSNYWYYAKEDPEVAELMTVLIKDLLKIGDEVLEAEGDLTGCVMVADDGYYPSSILEIAEEMSCTHGLMAGEAIDYFADIAA